MAGCDGRERRLPDAKAVRLTMVGTSEAKTAEVEVWEMGFPTLEERVDPKGMPSGEPLEPDGFSFVDSATEGARNDETEDGRDSCGASGAGAGAETAAKADRRLSTEAGLLAGLSVWTGGAGLAGAGSTAAARCCAAWDLVTRRAGGAAAACFDT